jgi:YbgC/YbaW family acyl-CoA thioester hydrolase
MPFTHSLRPRYCEVDMQRVVFNGHWLAYFDDASTRFFESLGFDPRGFVEGRGFDAMVVKAVLEWQSPATFDDVVTIAVMADRIGNKSFDLRFRASVEGRPACEGVITYVSVTPGTKESAPIPAPLRQGLESALQR